MDIDAYISRKIGCELEGIFYESVSTRNITTFSVNDGKYFSYARYNSGAFLLEI